MHFVSMYVSCLSPCWIRTHSYQSHVFTTIVPKNESKSKCVFYCIHCLFERLSNHHIPIWFINSPANPRQMVDIPYLWLGANMCLYICLYVYKICRFKHHINWFPRVSWIVIKLWCSLIFRCGWFLKWETQKSPVSILSHGHPWLGWCTGVPPWLRTTMIFHYFPSLQRIFPQTPPSFPKCLSNKNPNSRLFSHVCSAFSPRCAGRCRNAVEGHCAAFPRLFWLNNCEATWWNDNAWSTMVGPLLTWLTSLCFPRWELANAKLAGYFGVSTAIWMIWGWVKTLVPSEPQNSWQMDVHPTKNCINRYWSIPIWLCRLTSHGTTTATGHLGATGTVPPRAGRPGRQIFYDTQKRLSLLSCNQRIGVWYNYMIMIEDMVIMLYVNIFYQYILSVYCQ